MPVARKVSNTPQRSLQQKAVKYLAIRNWIRKEEPYGFWGFTVLLVTKPTKRGKRITEIQEMLQTLKHEEGYSPKFFLIGDHTLVNENVLLKPWFTAESTVVISDVVKR